MEDFLSVCAPEPPSNIPRKKKDRVRRSWLIVASAGTGCRLAGRRQHAYYLRQCRAALRAMKHNLPSFFFKCPCRALPMACSSAVCTGMQANSIRLGRPNPTSTVIHGTCFSPLLGNKPEYAKKGSLTNERPRQARR